ncbi:MAG: PaaI family thioesterase [Bacillota bacterium]
MKLNLTKSIENDRFAAYNGIKLVEIKPGFAVAEMEINENHLNGVDLVHGAAIFSLADYAFAAASNSKGVVTVSVNASIAYFKSPKGPRLVAEAEEISSSKKLCNYNIDIFDENKELVARFIGTGYKKSS